MKTRPGWQRDAARPPLRRAARGPDRDPRDRRRGVRAVARRRARGPQGRWRVGPPQHEQGCAPDARRVGGERGPPRPGRCGPRADRRARFGPSGRLRARRPASDVPLGRPVGLRRGRSDRDAAQGRLRRRPPGTPAQADRRRGRRTRLEDARRPPRPPHPARDLADARHRRTDRRDRPRPLAGHRPRGPHLDDPGRTQPQRPRPCGAAVGLRDPPLPARRRGPPLGHLGLPGPIRLGGAVAEGAGQADP